MGNTLIAERRAARLLRAEVRRLAAVEKLLAAYLEGARADIARLEAQREDVEAVRSWWSEHFRRQQDANDALGRELSRMSAERLLHMRELQALRACFWNRLVRAWGTASSFPHFVRMLFA